MTTKISVLPISLLKSSKLLLLILLCDISPFSPIVLEIKIDPIPYKKIFFSAIKFDGFRNITETKKNYSKNIFFEL